MVRAGGWMGLRGKWVKVPMELKPAGECSEAGYATGGVISREDAALARICECGCSLTLPPTYKEPTTGGDDNG
jgi:hypothetical protein